MPSVTFNLDNISLPGGLYAIERGATFDLLTLLHPDNLSTWTPCGQIRSNYIHKDNELLATFSFHPILYGEVTLADNTVVNRTLIRPYLTAAETSLLPLTSFRDSSRSIAVGRNAWVYDIKLTSPAGVVLQLVRGFVQVIPNVSDC